MAISLEQAKRLFVAGHISSDLYDKLTHIHSDREETEALKSAGKEDLIPRPVTQAEMEKYRTWGTPPKDIPAQDSPKTEEPEPDDSALLTPPTEIPQDGGGTSRLAFNQKIDDPNQAESGSGIQMGGDPYDPLNGEIPGPPQPTYNGPRASGIGAMNEQQENGQGVPLSGFQRGVGTESQPGTLQDAAGRLIGPLGRALVSPPAAPPAAAPPAQVAPGDPGFAASILGQPAAPAPQAQGSVSQTATGPKPGEPGFNILNTPAGAAAQPAPQAPAGGTQPRVQIKNVPKGAGQVDLSDVQTPGTIQLKGFKPGMGQIVEGGAPPGSLASDQTSGRAPVSGGGGGAAVNPAPMMGQHMADLERSYQEQKGGLKASADADSAESDLISKHMQNQAYDLQARERAQQEDAAKAQAVMQQRIDEIDKKNTELQNTKIDAHRLYNNASTGEKILGGIGLALGAMGAASPYNHGENKGWTVISNAIDRDLKAQQVDLETGFAGTKARSGLLRDYMDVTKDKRVAYEAARMDYIQRAKMQLDNIGASFKGPQAQAKYKVAAGQLDERLAEQKLKLDQALLASGRGGGAGAPKGEAEDLKFVSEQMLKEGIPAVESALDEAERVANSGENMGLVARDGLDTLAHVPIVGSLAKKAYSSAEPEAMRNEQALQQLNQTIRKSMTGVGFSEKEAETYADQLFADRSPEGIREGVRLGRKMIAAKKAEIQAGIGNRPEKGVTSRGRSAREESELRHAEEGQVQAGKTRQQQGPGVPGAVK